VGEIPEYRRAGRMAKKTYNEKLHDSKNMPEIKKKLYTLEF
jgi:hypothetical protein